MNLKKFIFIVLVLLSYLSVGCEPQNLKEDVSFSWKFESVRGVMDSLSCYCFNAGYVETDDGEKISVCFDHFDEEINCENIHVTWNYGIKKINPETTSPC